MLPADAQPKFEEDEDPLYGVLAVMQFADPAGSQYLVGSGHLSWTCKRGIEKLDHA